MLNYRKNGLVALHSALLFVLITGTFYGARAWVRASGVIRLNEEVNWLLYFAGIVVAVFWIHRGLRGVGDRLGALTGREASRLTVQQSIRLTVVLATLAFATKDVGISRGFLVGFLALGAVVLFVANRWGAPVLAAVFFRDRRLRTVIVAPREEARRLHGWLAPRGHLGIDAVGYVTPEPDGGAGDCLRLGGLVELPGLIARHRIDQLVFSRERFRREEIADVIRVAEQANCRVRFFVDLHAVFGGTQEALEHNEHYTFAASTLEPLDDPCNRILKRCLDLVVALPAVVLVLPPLTLVVWLMQRRQSPGVIFYGQLRSGLNRRRFRIYKFRTMHAGRGSEEVRQAAANDGRVFPFGRFLRRSSLDEVPQFLNVLLGSMSVSGPRPHMLEHDAQFSRQEHAYFKRHFVKPGITGLAQTKGYRGEMREADDLAHRVRYDALYVNEWSFGLDLGILARTAAQIVVPPRTAY